MLRWGWTMSDLLSNPKRVEPDYEAAGLRVQQEFDGYLPMTLYAEEWELIGKAIVDAALGVDDE